MALCTFWAQVFLNTRRKLPLIFDERQFQISLSPSGLGPCLASDKALFPGWSGVLFIRSGDDRWQGCEPLMWGMVSRPGPCSVFRKACYCSPCPDDLTSFVAAQSLATSCPCSWWTSQSSSNEQWNEKKVWVFVATPPSLCSLCGLWAEWRAGPGPDNPSHEKSLTDVSWQFAWTGG